MKQIKQGSAAFGLRLDYPSDWAVEDITDVTIRVSDLYGGDLLDATSATLWTDNTIQLNGAVSALANQIVLEDSLGGSVPALTTGDVLKIGHSAAGQWEIVQVTAWNATSKTATLDRDLRYAHSDHARVYAMWCTYDLDASDTTVFTLGKQLILTWTPDSDDLAIKERAEVAVFGFGFPGFEEAFASLYPYEYSAATQPEHRLQVLYDESYRQVSNELWLRGLDLSRVVNQELLRPIIAAKMRWLILLNGDDRYDASNEREIAGQEYQRQFELLATSTVWQDSNMDDVKDDAEVASHAWTVFCRGL